MVCVPREQIQGAPSSPQHAWLRAAFLGKAQNVEQGYSDYVSYSDPSTSGFCLPLFTARPPALPPSPPLKPLPPLPPLPSSPPPALSPLLPPPPPPPRPPPPFQTNGCRLLPGACMLKTGRRYCTTVQAINAHGLASPRITSNGMTVCGPPTAGTVVEVTLPVPPGSIHYGVHALGVPYQREATEEDDQTSSTFDSDFTRTNELRVRWHGFTDACALGIETYTVTLLRMPSAYNSSEAVELNITVLQRGVNLAAREAGHEAGFPLAEPGLYRVRVCGTAVTGLTACALSDGTYYDVTPPSDGQLCVLAPPLRWCNTDTTNSSGDASPAVGLLNPLNRAGARALWHGFGDAQSKIAGFRWAVGSAAGLDDVVRWKTVGWQTSAMLDFLLEPGALGGGATNRSAHVVITVVCVNGVGLESNASLPLIVDATPPEVQRDALLSSPMLPPGIQPVDTLFANTISPSILVNLSAVSDAESGILTVAVMVNDREASIRAYEATAVQTIALDANNAGLQIVALGELRTHMRYDVRLRCLRNPRASSSCVALCPLPLAAFSSLFSALFHAAPLSESQLDCARRSYLKSSTELACSVHSRRHSRWTLHLLVTV